jgi:hypothetical protein
MDGLKRLSGAKEVSQDDFSAGVGTYIVTFDAPPKVKIADIKKEIGKYKIEEIRMKITSKAEGNKAGDLTLANPKDDDLLKEVAAQKGKMLVLSGVLSEDDKGNRTLTLSKVAEAK